MQYVCLCVTAGLCPDWEDWDPKKAKTNAKEALDAAEKWLDVPQVPQLCSLRFASVQGGLYALGKAHMRFTPSREFPVPNVALETVPVFLIRNYLFLAAAKKYITSCSSMYRECKLCNCSVLGRLLWVWETEAS